MGVACHDVCSDKYLGQAMAKAEDLLVHVGIRHAGPCGAACEPFCCHLCAHNQLSIQPGCATQCIVVGTAEIGHLYLSLLHCHAYTV